MQWYRVDDKDITASSDLFIFRMRVGQDVIKRRRPLDDLRIKIMKIQVRKKQNVEFRDLGYKFLIDEDYYGCKEDYIDSKLWIDIEDILFRAEEILSSLGYIEDINIKKASEPDVLSAAARGFIMAMMKKKLLKPYYDETTLENMIVRALGFWVNKEPFDNNAEGIEREICLKELEIEISMLMSEPDMYFIGGWPQIFRSQKSLHDEDWLRDCNEDDDIEKEEYLKGSNLK